MLRRKEAVEQQHADVRRRVDAERSLRDAEQPAVAAAQAQRRELEGTRNELSAQLEELRTTTKSTKEGLLAARDSAQALAQRVADTKAAVEGARAMIVSSPEKARAEVAGLEEQVAHEQRALDDLDAQRRKVAQQQAVVAKADKDVIKAMTLMAEAEVRGWSARLPSFAPSPAPPAARSHPTPAFLNPPPPPAGRGGQAQAPAKGGEAAQV